jgi:hypothetical protein
MVNSVINYKHCLIPIEKCVSHCSCAVRFLFVAVPDLYHDFCFSLRLSVLWI